ncbi:hypothetical protein ACOYR1_03495 [Thalassotalea piscium]
MSHLALYQQIDDLSAEVVSLIQEDKFDLVDEKLALRLSLMKEVTELVLSEHNETSKEQLRQFLLKCQQADKQQVEHLLQERTKVLETSQKQTKITQAVNAYQQVSGS